jgi:hypothetical protein
VASSPSRRRSDQRLEPVALTRKPTNLVAAAKEVLSLYAMKKQIQIAAIQRDLLDTTKTTNR